MGTGSDFPSVLGDSSGTACSGLRFLLFGFGDAPSAHKMRINSFLLRRKRTLLDKNIYIMEVISGQLSKLQSFTGLGMGLEDDPMLSSSICNPYFTF